MFTYAECFGMSSKDHGFSDFPSEILDTIGKWLSKPDLGNLRLANQRCAVSFAQPMVRDIEVMYTAKSMQNMQHLSHHPILSQYVRHLNYFSPVLEHMEEEEVWQTIFDYLCPADEERPTEAVEEARRAATETQIIYKRLSMEQFNMDRDEKFASTLAKAASRFAKLQHISVQTHCYSGTSHLLAEAGTLPKGVDYEIFGESDGYQQYQNKDTLHAVTMMAAACENLNTFDMYDVYWYSLNAKPPLSEGSHTAFHSNLKSIWLSFAPWNTFFDGSSTQKLLQQELGKLLAKATGLRSLTLHFQRQQSNGHDRTVMFTPHIIPIMLENVLGCTNFEHLHDLQLSGITSSYSELSNYLQRHASSLKSLSLNDLCLTEGKTGVYLHKIFPQLRSSLGLVEVHLEGVWGSTQHGDDHVCTMHMNGSEARATERWIVAEDELAFSDLVLPKIDSHPYVS